MTSPEAPETTENAAGCSGFTVMYDGSCPLCRREIGLYKSLKPLSPVGWLDVSNSSNAINPTEQIRYMERFHVRKPDGQMLSGAEAFVQLWLVMPGWRWFGKIGLLPGVTPLLELAYKFFLKVRPVLQRWMRNC